MSAWKGGVSVNGKTDRRLVKSYWQTVFFKEKHFDQKVPKSAMCLLKKGKEESEIKLAQKPPDL